MVTGGGVLLPVIPGSRGDKKNVCVYAGIVNLVDLVFLRNLQVRRDGHWTVETLAIKKG